MSEHRTICLDFESGLQLATYPSYMNQVKEGELFHVGQTPYLVHEVLPCSDQDNPDGQLVIVLKKP